MYNTVMMDNIQSDKEMAQRLEHGAKAFGEQALRQAEAIDKGWKKLTWYCIA